MSLLDNSKEQLKNAAEKIFERVKESQLYANIVDRYQNASPLGQKLATLGAFVFVIGISFAIPFSNLFNSYSSISTFEDQRLLIRELFKTHRESTSSQNILPPPPSQILMSSIQNILQRAALLPEQNLGVNIGSAEGRLIPKNLVDNVTVVNLAKLNLKQIVDIGASLVGISESVKMKDILIIANKVDTRYYDVTYKLYSLKVPEQIPEPPPELEKKQVGKNKKNNADENEASE